MSDVPFPLMAVGCDCKCGHPLVWYGAERRCAVYGTHPPLADVDDRGPRSIRFVEDLDMARARRATAFRRRVPAA
jgi:hypothetical protein